MLKSNETRCTKAITRKSGCKETQCTHSCFAVTYRSIYICIRKIKTVAHASNGFIIVLFTFTRGNIFCNGTFRTLSHVAGFIGLYCSKKAITSFVIGVGVEAPAVTATFSTPCSHSN